MLWCSTLFSLWRISTAGLNFALLFICTPAFEHTVLVLCFSCTVLLLRASNFLPHGSPFIIKEQADIVNFCRFLDDMYPGTCMWLEYHNMLRKYYSTLLICYSTLKHVLFVVMQFCAVFVHQRGCCSGMLVCYFLIPVTHILRLMWKCCIFLWQETIILHHKAQGESYVLLMPGVPKNVFMGFCFFWEWCYSCFRDI